MQVQRCLHSRHVSKETVTVQLAEAQLTALSQSPGVTEKCAAFLRELDIVLKMCGNIKGRGSISRKLVRLVVIEYGRRDLPLLKHKQQSELRAKLGRKIALDHTYKSVRSLAGRSTTALTAHGKPKLVSFEASLLTGTAEHGYVLLAAIVPSDAHEYQASSVSSLFAATPDDAPLLHELIREVIALGGCVHRLAAVMFTDHVAKDTNLFQKMSQAVLAACLANGVKVMAPQGV